MDALQAILTRRSYRGKYREMPVPRTHLQAIMEAGCAAPSGCNKQTPSFIAVDDPDLLRRLKALVTPPVAETAPAWILVLTRPIIAYRNRRFNVQDYAAAIENMLIAIHALGYASCWYEGHITDDDDIAGQSAGALNLPEPYRVVCVLPVGVPEGEPAPVNKLPLNVRTGFNQCPETWS